MGQNIHATCINLNSKGILILGASGSGKSDLALRLITMFSAKLVSDDRTDVQNVFGRLEASAPKTLEGLLEVRGVGIIKTEYIKKTNIDVAIELTTEKPERMPDAKKYEIEGIKIPLFYLNPFEVSAPSKAVAILSLL